MSRFPARAQARLSGASNGAALDATAKGGAIPLGTATGLGIAGLAEPVLGII